MSVQNNGLSTAACKRNATASEALVCPEFEFPFSDNLSWHDILKQLLMLYYCGGLICGNERGLSHGCWKMEWKRGKYQYISDIGAA